MNRIEELVGKIDDDVLMNGLAQNGTFTMCVVLRILYEDLSDAQFYSLCMKLGGHRIFKIVKDIDKGKSLH
jgi:hypothetical protein